MELAEWPYFAEDEVQAVKEVLHCGRVNYWTGDRCKLFEQQFAQYLGVKHAISVANGTVALELALRALEIGPGDEVIVPCKTFIATASAVVAQGAKPVLADIDQDSQTLTLATIEAQRTSRTKAIIVVHLGGWPADVPAIMAYANQHNLYVIEDCAQAHGATINGQKVGSFGHINAFSFCQDKILSTGGEGGLVVTNDEKLWSLAWAYKDHGKNYHTVFHKHHNPGFRYLHEDFGTNFRMTEMQAAIGIKQLEKLPNWLALRTRNALCLYKAIKNLAAFRMPMPAAHIQHAFYRFYVFVNPDFLKSDWNRERIILTLNESGVPCTVGGCAEIYLEQAFIKHQLVPKKRFLNAQILNETSLAFLVHPTLTESMMEQMAATIVDVAQMATRQILVTT